MFLALPGVGGVLLPNSCPARMSAWGLLPCVSSARMGHGSFRGVSASISILPPHALILAGPCPRAGLRPHHLPFATGSPHPPGHCPQEPLAWPGKPRQHFHPENKYVLRPEAVLLLSLQVFLLPCLIFLSRQDSVISCCLL